MSDERIEFYATVDKVQTMADGSFRVYLGLPETAIVQVAELMACHVHAQVLDFTVTAHGETRQNANDRQTEHRKIHI